jgi:diguanylate cyclase (GGDEF)-like protein
MTISPIKISLKLDENTIEAKPKQSRALILAIVLGLAGALLNSFPIELAYSLSLVLGNLAFIIAAAYLRPTLTLLCALICVAPLLFIWGHPFGFITFGLEAIFVSFMRGRGWYLPTADFLYWLIIGMPLTAALILLNNANAEAFLLFSLFKQSINAVFYTALAVIFIFVFRDKLAQWMKSQQPPLVKNLKQHLHYILWVMSAFFVVGVCLFISHGLNDIQHKQFEDKLNISSQYLSQIIESHVNEHINAIAQTANKLSAIEPSGYASALTKAHQLYPGYLTMLITDQDARLIATSPSSLLKNIPNNDYNVADRSYFSQAFHNEALYVSPVFLGRAFGVDPIVAISAPIYHNNNVQPVGIVEGSLNLNMFQQVNKTEENSGTMAIILTDENANVIYADKNLALAPLSTFSYSIEEAKLKHKLMVVGEKGVNAKMYLYRQTDLSNGWKIFVIVEHVELLNLIEQQYLTIFMSLFLIFIFVILLASQFAHTLNQPLEFALNELAHRDGKNGYKAMPFEAPTEFLTLYSELQKSQERLLKHQFVLEEKVEKRTHDLNQANKALKELANVDSLTGLYNRRYLETKFSELQSILSRNKATMVVAMLDLDRFKNLNDEYGHLMGDNCLEYVGQLMKSKFDRRSDIVARFGGEEFIIIAQHDEKHGVIKKLEELREEIACHCFPYDGQHYLGVTISIGVVTAQASYAEKIERWISLADEQLYWVKDNGRNKMSVTHLD